MPSPKKGIISESTNRFTIAYPFLPLVFFFQKNFTKIHNDTKNYDNSNAKNLSIYQRTKSIILLSVKLLLITSIVSLLCSNLPSLFDNFPLFDLSKSSIGETNFQFLKRQNTLEGHRQETTSPKISISPTEQRRLWQKIKAENEIDTEYFSSEYLGMIVDKIKDEEVNMIEEKDSFFNIPHVNSFPHQAKKNLDRKEVENNLGTIVVLAPPRNKGFQTNPDIFGPRFCLFLHMIQSVDMYLNQVFNTSYPIFVLLSNDPWSDPIHEDSIYTEEDLELIQKWAGSTPVEFIKINMYSKDGVMINNENEKFQNITKNDEGGDIKKREELRLEQLERWIAGEDSGTPGRPLGYRSMCRLWSGRVQSMSFLDPYKYYMRLDDDSYFTSPLDNDPFLEMEKDGITYA